MEIIAQYTIGGIALIFTIITANKIRLLFSKKNKYSDSVSASRRQNELIGRKRR
jgi:hypothetical protein